jgi:hypothetical protein
MKISLLRMRNPSELLVKESGTKSQEVLVLRPSDQKM